VKEQAPEEDALDAPPLSQHNRRMKEFNDKAESRRKNAKEAGAEILPFRARPKPEPVKAGPAPAAEDDHVEPLSNSALLKIGLLIVGLIAGGVWLMNALRDAGRLEDCAMQGRRNCMPISVPDRNQ
jgi:hypothetical protein